MNRDAPNGRDDGLKEAYFIAVTIAIVARKNIYFFGTLMIASNP